MLMEVMWFAHCHVIKSGILQPFLLHFIEQLGLPLGPPPLTRSVT